MTTRKPSPYMFWRGTVYGLKTDTEAERQYAEGVLYALAMLVQDPGRASITADQLAEIEQVLDRKTAEAPTDGT